MCVQGTGGYSQNVLLFRLSVITSGSFSDIVLSRIVNERMLSSALCQIMIGISLLLARNPTHLCVLVLLKSRIIGRLVVAIHDGNSYV